MAEVIVSGNLNSISNAGQFETDRSTWGFPDTGDYQVTRSTDQKTAGLYGAKVKALTTQGLPTTYGLGIQAGYFYAELNKRYLVKAQVYVPVATPISDDTAIITFQEFLGGIPATQISFVNKTVLQAKGVFVQVECRLYNTNYTSNQSVTIGLKGTGAAEDLIMNGLMYIDQLEIYEYIIVEDEPEVCDVEIDPATTIIVNETAEAAADGSIEVEATGTGTLEYSKDGGANYQLSNVFAGLTTGIYIIRVRKVATPSCYDEYPFALNFAAVTHNFTTAVTNESFAGLEDGAIAITPSGTGGPFEYSIDAGVTFQAGNLFEDLAPGTYYVAVRNAAGNSVVHVVTVAVGSAEIDKTYHSKNPITKGMGASPGWEALTNYRLYNDVRVEDVADSGAYVSKLKVELPPDVDSLVTFYLGEAFRGVFTFTPPTLNHATIIRLTDRIRRFKNFSGEITEDDVTPASLTASAANLVLWGGVSKFHFPGLNFFTDYLTANKKFLTWAPLEKYVDRLQEDYLNFWCYGNFTTLKLRITAYFDDATNQTDVVVTLAGTGYTKLYQVPAGPANSGVLLINPAKNVTHYQLVLLDQDDDTISEVRTYYIEQVRHPLTRFFMFLNSLGAYEVLKFTGQVTEKVSFNREVVQKFLAHNYTALDGEFAINRVLRQKQKSISSGFVKNRLPQEWHEYLEDFMGSPIVFDVTDGQRFPIVITAGEHNTEDQNYERFIRVDARDAYENESFTPKEI